VSGYQVACSLSRGRAGPPFLRDGPTGAASTSVAVLAIRYVLLPFFARNLLISAFVGSPRGAGYSLYGAVPVGLGNRA
jgi:hypothetical protein